MYRKALFPTLALALVSACSTDVPAPTALTLGSLTPSAVKGLKGTPNRIKPSNNGKKPGTGGSGSSTMELSALLGMDGTTTIEASTGSLEDGTTNGTFSKVQLKLYALPDTFTANFTGLTAGYWTTTDTRLRAGDSIQGKGTIKPASGKGTDNVTVVTTVHLRPDLQVKSITWPAPALRGIPTTFTAFVAELNGDRGARSDCIFSVDGVDVDHADGIWVDAGVEVACVFDWAFVTVGSHSVAVRVENVKPGDWDLSNNSATVTVKVIHPVTPAAHGNASVVEEHRHELVSTDTSRITGSGLNLRHKEWHRTDVAISGNDPVAYPQPLGIQAFVFKDGAIAHSAALTLSLESDKTFSDGTHVICYAYHELGQHGRSCTTTTAAGPGGTFYSYAYTGGYTSFYGQNIFCAFGFCQSFDSGSGQTGLGGNTLGFGAGSTARLLLLGTDALGDGHSIDRSLPTFQYFDYDLHQFFGCIDVKIPGAVGYRACEWFDRDGYQVSSGVSW